MPASDLGSQSFVGLTAKLEQEHFELLAFNRHRFSPDVPRANWREEVAKQGKTLIQEGELIEHERQLIQPLLRQLPNDAGAFMDWFKALRETGPGQNDSLFPWLAESATLHQMKYFLRQEVAGEAGFEDLTALTQLKMPARVKLELARNYWDEMGRGNERGMHGPMLTALGEELNLDADHEAPLLPETIALANLMIGMAANRRLAYHSIGALGVIELTAPDRAKHVYRGLERLGVSPA
jgi:hypothetical protein